MRIKQMVATMAMMAIAITMSAQDKLFTLEDLNFGGRNYANLRPQNMWLTWWGEQLIQTDVEACYKIDTKTGKKSTLFTLDDINKWAGSNDTKYVRHLMNASFPYPNKSLVLLGNRKSVILLDFVQKKIVWQDSIAGQQANDWHAASRATAYVEADQLFVVDGQGKKHQLSTDGSREIVYGQSVHRNEFGIRKGTFWSPDGQKLAFYRMDQRMVTDYPQVNIFPRNAQHEPDKYPMAGMTSHKVTVGVYDLKTDKTVYLQAGNPTDRYFTNITWSPDAKTVYMFELNRKQNDCRLVAYDAATGQKTAELYRETSNKYVEPQNPIVFLPWDASKFVMQSQKDGYNHLYLFDQSGKELKQLTSGTWVVMELVGFNEKTKSIVYTSNEVDPRYCNLWSLNLKTGKRQLLDRGIGVIQRAQLSATGQKACLTLSTPNKPRLIDIVTTGKQSSLNLLDAPDPWKDYQQPIYTSGSIKAADGVTDLYYRMVKPHDFDPNKKYPTVVYVYGGPHAHNVDASWHWLSRPWETYMAQKGYICFIIDNRGSENRGRDFEQATWHQLGQIEMQDQMKGVDFLRQQPYVDMNRLGVHGWSFGGFMTISLMTNYPDVFKVGVAGGPVIDWKWYEVMYGERYMGTPQDNPEGYAKSSLISKAKNLKGKLQIITGYNDNTVVPQHCLSFLDACIKAGTQPDFFAYPGEEHNMRGHASVHLHERITQYFEDYLK
ncbi:S9 family peptidase [Prevotella sp. P6B4]|uniref:S9 family peptidase n=1 Tax=Prevotella sp. P6B4 TaxID=1410614 RepID=UPI00049037E9|nr:S9 family peptidase [Prevotella sp. P6B4]